MPTTPRGSPPMYLPAAPFALADAVTCATLIDVAYDQYTQWQNQDYPSKSNFVWTPPNNGYRYSVPLFWTVWWGESYDEPFGFVAVNANSDAFLVFRGTVSDADWDQDATASQVAYGIVPGYGNVHEGFYEIYQQLSPQVGPAIGSLNASFKRLFVTGHSLGCGLSSLAVPDLITNMGIKPAQLLHYNLASPRVGDPQYAYIMNNNGVPTYRIVNTEDLVPDTPSAVFFGYLYKHIGIPVDFTAQYGTLDGNHTIDTCYEYALAHPNDPEGPLPASTLRVARLTGIRVAVQGKMTRLAPPPAADAAAPPT